MSMATYHPTTEKRWHHKLVEEIQVVAIATLNFAICFSVLMALTRLYRAGYNIEFRGFSRALVGALMAAKVALVMEQEALGQWAGNHPAPLEVARRTVLNSIGAFVVLLLERGFEAQHAHNGFVPGLGK